MHLSVLTLGSHQISETAPSFWESAERQVAVVVSACFSCQLPQTDEGRWEGSGRERGEGREGRVEID